MEDRTCDSLPKQKLKLRCDHEWHPTLLGKDPVSAHCRTREAQSYPPELCRCLAEAYVAFFEPQGQSEPEPLPAGHPLLDRENVVVTPHIASASVAGRRRLYEHSIENALAVLDGPELRRWLTR